MEMLVKEDTRKLTSLKKAQTMAGERTKDIVALIENYAIQKSLVSRLLCSVHLNIQSNGYQTMFSETVFDFQQD